MTAVHEAALAAWDAADETARRRVLSHAKKQATRAYEAEIGRGQATGYCAPTLEVVRARRELDRLIVVVATSYRVYHYAQSGSDWSTQYIAFHELTVGGGGPLLDQRLAAEERNASERDSEGHDDAAELRDAIAGFIAKHPPQ
jgi:hypothetical protein